MSDYDIPDDLKYTTDDEWLREEDDTVVIGVTDYAQQQLGDVVFVELPEPGATLTRGDSFGVIESVKAVADLYAPVSGSVVAVNGELAEDPEIVNSDCYGEGWMLEIRPSDAEEMLELLDSDSYQKSVEERSD